MSLRSVRPLSTRLFSSVSTSFSAVPDVLSKHSVLVRFPVHWGEMDSFSHINNVQYFKFFESARIAHFRRLGAALTRLDERSPTPFDFAKFMNATGVGPILSQTSCKFRVPGSYPDSLIAASKIDVEAIADDRFVMRYLVYSEQKKKVLAEGEGTIVMYDYSQSKKTTLPTQLLNAIKAVDKETPTFCS